MSTTPRLLIIDDDKLLLSTLAAFFEDEGFEVLRADSGEQALDILASKTMDVAIVDMRLPGMDGEKFIVKAADQQAGIRFLIYTGSANYRPSGRLKKIGMTVQDVIFKPQVDMEVVLAAVNRLVNNRGET
jgi:DNA-binding response OmpR family regulator